MTETGLSATFDATTYLAIYDNAQGDDEKDMIEEIAVRAGILARCPDHNWTSWHVDPECGEPGCMFGVDPSDDG